MPQAKVALSTAESIQAIQSIVQRCLTNFVLFNGRDMTCKEYDKFVADNASQYGAKASENMGDNELVFHLKLMATRGLRSCAQMNTVEQCPLVIHCVGAKHWRLASFLCRAYPLNVILIYVLTDDQLPLVRAICHSVERLC